MSALALASSGRAKRVIALGVMWGIAAGVMEGLVLPTVEGGAWSYFGLLAGNSLAWSVIGIAIAGGVECAGWRLERPVFLAFAIGGGALVLGAAASVLFAIGPLRAIGPGRVIPVDVGLSSYLYQSWIVAFYGGLYVVAWSLVQRATRMRAVLAQADMARMRSETLLGEAQLRALRGHVDPRVLLRALREIEARRTRDAATADALMARLVAFLRASMPGVRSDASTLAEELALASSYACLCHALVPERAAWEIDSAHAHRDIAFPPLLILPLLDALTAHGDGVRGRIVVTRDDAGVHVAFHAAGLTGRHWLPDDLAYRLRVGLSTLHGKRGVLQLRDEADGGPALVLHLPAPTKGPP